MIDNHIYKIFLIAGLILAQGDVYADQHEATVPDEQIDVQSAPPQPAPSNQETTTPSESFMPTETISEDLSVPFPVDI